MNPEEADHKPNKPSKFRKKTSLKNSSFLMKKSNGVYGFGPNLVQEHFEDHKPTKGRPRTHKRQTPNPQKADHKPTRGRP